MSAKRPLKHSAFRLPNSALPLVAFDEFTSVVDRNVARIGSAAVAKAIRSGQIRCRFVAVTCHYDIIDWLAPDWIIDMATREFAWCVAPKAEGGRGKAEVETQAFDTLNDAMRRHIEAALGRTKGRIEGPRGAAKLLGINPHTLRARMRRLKVDWRRFRPED
jgi:transcriptional regulator with GAF, ATPase, and Fis domain